MKLVKAILLYTDTLKTDKAILSYLDTEYAVANYNSDITVSEVTTDWIIGFEKYATKKDIHNIKKALKYVRSLS